MALNDSQPASARKPLRFGYAYSPAGAHPGGWRHAGGGHDAFDPNQITQIARKAEAAGFDFIHFGERLLPDADAGRTNPEALARTEPFTAASFLATRTQTIGILATANTSYYEPFNLARLTASLDHVTHGRAGWNVITGATRAADRNFSKTETSAEEHYARAGEVVEIIRKLWDSWEDDAFVRNKQTGEYVDGTKIHPIHHAGRLFKIAGPLNVARPPQGQPVLSHDVTSDASAELAAREADVAFVAHADRDEARRRVEDLRRRAAAHGRDRSSLIVLSAIVPVVGATTEDARRTYDELNGKVRWDDSQLEHASSRLGVTTDRAHLDDVIDDALAQGLSEEGKALLAVVRERTGRAVGLATPPRVSDLVNAALLEGDYLVGSAADLADRIDALAGATDVDGFVVRAAYLPGGLDLYAELLAPELKARGLLRQDDERQSLRARLGLKAPANRYEAA